MHEVKVKGILSAKNGMNLYRGCSHGCIYCDSRSRCYQMDHDFEDIEVKSNALDLLQEINQHTRAIVQMTLTTWDDELCKILEPGVCPSSRRFQVLKELQRAGIPTVVWLTPILPHINDTEANVRALLECCMDAGVSGILWFGAGVTLREGNREYFYRQLDRHFPGMKEQYMREFGNRYVASSLRDRELTQIVQAECDRHHVSCSPEAAFAELQRFEDRDEGKQLSFLKGV